MKRAGLAGARPIALSWFAAAALLPSAALADAPGHGVLAPVAGALALILLCAKLGGDLASRVGQPAVLGELLAGVALGNLKLAGFAGLEFIKADPSIDLLAQLGVVLLLFEVGLESTVPQMLQVGAASLRVATLGVIAPMLLGFAVGRWLLPHAPWQAHLFLGATLSATSVGITARVLQDLGRSQSREARVILGAAVLDDILGLVVLAVVGGIISAADRGGSVSLVSIGAIVGKAAAFLVGSLALGVALSRRLFHLASKLQARHVLLAVGLAFCFLLSWLSGAIGLAPIVGAFAAGLILEDVHYRDFVGRGEPSLDELVRPIVGFLAPVFFVVMGMRTDLSAFARPGAPALAVALTAAAIAGKLACSAGVFGRSVDRLSVGIGMIPRGEVGLIFANLGLQLSVRGVPMIDPVTYSAIVAMVIATTLVAPPALKWSLKRGERRRG